MVQCHSEVRDTIYDIAVIAWGQTMKESVMGVSPKNSSRALLWADIRVRGVYTGNGVV